MQDKGIMKKIDNEQMEFFDFKGETLSVQIVPDEFTDKISKAFDYEFSGKSEFVLPCFEIPKEFNVGIIVGSSGSGKTQLLKRHFNYKEDGIVWDRSKAVVSHFANPDEAIERMFAVGLSSVPSLCKPFHVLSNGEQFRAVMARKLETNAVIDEFTSVVNRETAKSVSVSISKYIRNKNLKGIVLASCHKDILEWLEPDWVFDTDSNELGINDVDFSKGKKDAEIIIY